MAAMGPPQGSYKPALADLKRFILMALDLAESTQVVLGRPMFPSEAGAEPVQPVPTFLSL